MDAIRFQARVLVSSLALIVTVAIHPGVAWGADATYVPGKSMWAAKRSNVRTGPGTSYRIVDLLEVGEQVRVIAKTGNWYQLEPRAGLPERFVYAPLLTSTRLVAETVNYNDGIRYHGPTRNGLPHGRGIMTWANGNRYEGDWVNGRRTGRGVYTWAGGDRYEGDFVDGERTGRGVYTWADGDRYEGDFVDGQRAGRGLMVWGNGDRYEGSWKDNKLHDFATGAQTAGAMQCIEHTGGATYRNGCNRPVAFHYCFVKRSVGSTCGKPAVEELVDKPEHYYTHWNAVQPGESFEVPAGDREEFNYAVCPQRGNSASFYHAVSSSPGMYRCQALYPWIARRKAERSAQLAERVKRQRERVASEQSTRRNEGWVSVVDGYRNASYRGGVLGMAAGQRSRSAAIEAAMRDCRSRGGVECGQRSGRDAWKKPCIAVAEAAWMGEEELFFNATGDTRSEAESNAETYCRGVGATGCFIARAMCG